MEKLAISAVWWNTNLSPPISSLRDTASSEKRTNISEILSKFMDFDTDFICLGEIADEDIEFISNYLQIETKGYACAKGTEKVGRVFFDTCIFYKRIHELIREDEQDSKFFTLQVGSRTIKYGQKYKFKFWGADEWFILYLSHWPSKLKDTTIDLPEIAINLRFDFSNEKHDKNLVMLMGDYNVEPYDISIVNHIQSTRDRNVVQKKPNVFYNPCWKFLSSHQFSDSKKDCVHGSYYYESGNLQKWYVLDQIMLSSSFLKGKWSFKDEDLDIVDLSSTKGNEASDHYPLRISVEREKS